MNKAELKRKYPDEKIAQIRKWYASDVDAWSSIKREGDLDMQCITDATDDPSFVAGPWPEAEWRARHTAGQERPCLHEDVLTQYVNQVVNQIELNPMGIEASPMGDGADKESAEFLENRIREIEYAEGAQYDYLTAVTSAVQRSYGWWKLETAYRSKFGQKICIDEILDPNTVTPGFFKRRDASDMRRCWENSEITHEEFNQKYPEFRKDEWKSLRAIDGMDMWITDNTVRVCAWWHLDIDERELLKIDSPEGEVHAYADEFKDGTKKLEGKITARRKEKRAKVLKTIFNGIEVLDETEWIDPGELDEDGNQISPPEIPVFFVGGRIKYDKNNKRTIESLIRKGRPGQLRYDYVISTIQEVTAITGKPVRVGPEGTFDTSTNWSPRANTAYKEWKPVYDEQGNLLPPPIFELYEPPIQALELEKESILRGIQNAIGMASTERKDRAAKSGKALEQMKEDLAIGSSHYFGALRVAQERQYRVLQRILPIIEKDQAQVGVRDKFGKHQMMPANYRGRHAIAVGTGKLHQTLQEKQEETAGELLQIKEPNVLMAVLPGALRMKGIGEYGEQLAKMIEAIQDPRMQSAREGKGEIPPEAMAAMQQAQESLRALDAYAKQLEQKVIELEEQINAKVVESQTKKEISAADNATKIRLEEMKFEHEKALKQIELMIEKLRASVTFGTKGADLDSKERMQAAEHSHSSSENAANREAAAMEGEANRQAAEKQAAMSANSKTQES